MRTHNTGAVRSIPPCITVKALIGEEGNGNPPRKIHCPRNSEPCLWFLLHSKSSMQHSTYSICLRDHEIYINSWKFKLCLPFHPFFRFHDPTYYKLFEEYEETGHVTSVGTFSPLPPVHAKLMRVWVTWLENHPGDFRGCPAILVCNYFQSFKSFESIKSRRLFKSIESFESLKWSAFAHFPLLFEVDKDI